MEPIIRVIITTLKVTPSSGVFCNCYAVHVDTVTATWDETYGTKDLLNAFVRGVRAGAAMHGDHSIEVTMDGRPYG